MLARYVSDVGHTWDFIDISTSKVVPLLLTAIRITRTYFRCINVVEYKSPIDSAQLAAKSAVSCSGHKHGCSDGADVTRQRGTRPELSQDNWCPTSERSLWFCCSQINHVHSPCAFFSRVTFICDYLSSEATRLKRPLYICWSVGHVRGDCCMPLPLRHWQWRSDGDRTYVYTYIIQYPNICENKWFSTQKNIIKKY